MTIAQLKIHLNRFSDNTVVFSMHTEEGLEDLIVDSRRVLNHSDACKDKTYASISIQDIPNSVHYADINVGDTILIL